MSDAQVWTFVTAIVAVLLLAMAMTLTFLRRVIDRRFDRMSEQLQMWFDAYDRRQETLELQRANIETRLTMIDLRLNSVDVVALDEVQDSVDHVGE